MPCKHCHSSPVTRSRGLCWRCVHTPRIRDLYEPLPPANRSGRSHRLSRPCIPTAAMPGSAEKIQVLTQRATRGEELFHALDASLLPTLALYDHHALTSQEIAICEATLPIDGSRLYDKARDNIIEILVPDCAAGASERGDYATISARPNLPLRERNFSLTIGDA
jgi:hypothetical protein